MGGISPLLPIVIPGTIAALLVLSPLKSEMGIEKYPISRLIPVYFFANSSTDNAWNSSKDQHAGHFAEFDADDFNRIQNGR